MIKITLTREEIEQAITEYAKDKILSYDLLNKNSIKVSQGKSASATILIMPNDTSEADVALAVLEENETQDQENPPAETTPAVATFA